MRMPVFGLGNGYRIEAPNSIPPFDLVCQPLRHQPIEHAIEGHPIKIKALRPRSGFNFLMTQRTRRGQQDIEHMLARRCGAHSSIEQSFAGLG